MHGLVGGPRPLEVVHRRAAVGHADETAVLVSIIQFRCPVGREILLDGTTRTGRRLHRVVSSAGAERRTTCDVVYMGCYTARTDDRVETLKREWIVTRHSPERCDRVRGRDQTQ